MPHRESVREADALRFWDGRGAVRLLAAAGHNVLLLERIVPGTPLEPGDLATAAGVLRALHRAPPAGHPFRALAAEAERWRAAIPAKWPSERALVDRALGLIAELGPTQGEAVVLHQDLHAGNVLLSAERGWLAIDPKPLAGEREFDVVALARNAANPGRCVDELAARLELDRERARGWAFVQALAWDNVDVARALL